MDSALLQWLYNNGSKYPAIMDGLLMEALDAFPNESTDQVAYLKYITKMAKRSARARSTLRWDWLGLAGAC